MPFRTLLMAVLTIYTHSANATGAESVTVTDTCMSMVFRETPYADIRCGRRITPRNIGDAKHFQLDHDSKGRLIEIRFMQAGALRPYSDRFVRAPRTTITYQDNIETRHYYNEHGHRALAAGNVYETRITRDKEGRRTSLTFHGINAQLVENDFSIASYEWHVEDDGDVVERRYDIDGNVQRNRPGFGYLITRFSYDARGLLFRMTNLGEDGARPTADDAGIVSTVIHYDENRQFTGWLNLDKNHTPKRGMSDIAEIRYLPSLFAGEKDAWFFDADGTPQLTRWGAHRVAYEFDQFGNETHRRHYGTDGASKNANNGVGEIRSTWTPDGAHRISRAYFDIDEKPVGVGSSNIHETRSTIDDQGRLVKNAFFSLNGENVMNPSIGYASEEFIFDDEGRLTEQRFTNAANELTNHNVWGVSNIRYEYANDHSLMNVIHLNAAGETVTPQWNPAH